MQKYSIIDDRVLNTFKLNDEHACFIVHKSQNVSLQKQLLEGFL